VLGPYVLCGVGCAVELAAGARHTCARKADGTLWCWGQAWLADGTTQLSPVHVSALGTSVVQVATGSDTTCARKADGTLWCWGGNSQGQVGDGTTTGTPSPVQVTALGMSVAEVAVGWYSSFARKGDGTLWLWGSNQYGLLGNGTTCSPFPCGEPLPVQVTALGASVVEIETGGGHACARKGGGTLWCWGQNSEGELGDGTTVEKLLPVQVTTLGTTVVEVAAAISHVCARKEDGTLWCWGRNLGAQLGDGTKDSKTLPVQVLLTCP
jgi:alpha-tubulin suppressor-like RCC1 family protein